MKLRYIIGLLILLVCTPVYATDITTSVSGKSNIDAGEQFTLTLNVTGDNVWGLSGNIGYDTSKFTLVSSEGLNGFTSMVGTGFSLDSANGKSGAFGILSLTFKATSSFRTGESSTISFSNLTGASDSSRLSATGSQKTITVNIPKSDNSNLSTLKVDGNNISGFSVSNLKYDLGNTDSDSMEISAVAQDNKATVSGTGKKSLSYGKNTFNVVVKAENGSTKTYTITINRNDNRSSNNYLKSLKISNAKISFNKYTLNYNIVVDNTVDSIDIQVQPEDSKSSVRGTGKKNLNIYLNTYNVVVTAENGSKRVYKINISRKDENGNAGSLSTNNKLNSIEIKGYNITFDPDTLKYSITVDNTVEQVEISANVMDKNSTIKINNVDKLTVGENLITIEVLSQSGDTRTYEIMVLRKDNVPVVSVKDVIDTINKTTSKSIEVEIKDEENTLSSNILKELKGKDIELKITKYENDNIKYIWSISGKNIKEEFDFDTLVKFESENADKINELMNYAQSIYLNYSHSGNLPKNTKFKVYVGNEYNENDLLNLYYFDEKSNKMILEQENLVVKNGFVEYEIEHCSEYILTQSKIKNSNFDYKNIIIIIETIVIIGGIIYMSLKSKNIKINFKRKTNKKI